MKAVYSLSLSDFLAYLKTVDYGYKDVNGVIHTGEEFDFEKYPYAFSSPAEVTANSCAWCWDICELIRDYCRHNGIPVSTWFYEYQSGAIHQTHTQAFIKTEGQWYPAPDNSDPHLLSDFTGKRYDEVIKEFQGYFRDFIRHITGGEADESRFLFREYGGGLKSGMSDEDVLRHLREG
ncbi:MAG: hypothetical protein IJU78_06150 [Clostridia bacterium]|nr:hypothetical protein [Clostridia bacterium]